MLDIFPRTGAGIAASMLQAVVNGLLRAVRHRRAIKTLSELSDDALKDIGLNRGDVEHAAIDGRCP